jgi:diguanylate cyclase (GGDEF)-like protein/PAS domain S-box-containing protein
VNPTTPRILVVDDDNGARRLTRATLKRAGFDVVEAEDGRQAMELVRAGMPDLVLLDVSMPVMDGFAACAELRALPDGDAVPVMMMTGLDDVESIERAFSVGATDFITKPINWPILAHRVRYMLRASAAINALHESERRLSNAQRIGDMGDWVWTVEADRIVPSEQAWRILGLDAQRGALTLSQLLGCVHLEDRNRVRSAFEQALTQAEGFAVQHRVVQADGALRHVHQQIEVVDVAEGRALQLVGAIHDVTQRTDAEEQIRRLAYYDALTGLPNRLLFRQKLQTALDHAQRHGHKLALMFIDLDNFKRVNDTMGHTAGDELLQTVSERLLRSIRVLDAVSRISGFDSDGPSLARLGGDEFTVMVSEVAGPDDAAAVARRLVKALNEPITVQGTELYVGGSVGIALYPDDGVDLDTLLKNADTAMYRAKEAGKGSFHFYDPSMTERAMVRLATELQLRRAIERDEFVLHFQPRVDVATGRIVGAEALLRWQHPERGLVMPEEFVALAEECNLLTAIGEWVLSSACRQLAAWRTQAPSGLPLAINLAASHLREPLLPAAVAYALSYHGLAASLLEIEVTESVMLADPEASIRNAMALHELGVRLSLDDFGTGYSSLSYLKRLPVSCLKIDKSFVREMTFDNSSAGIVTAIVAMGHTLGLTVVAEGVEQDSQFDALRERGCDEFQGFLYSAALPASEFAALVAEQTCWSPAGADTRARHTAAAPRESLHG